MVQAETSHPCCWDFLNFTLHYSSISSHWPVTIASPPSRPTLTLKMSPVQKLGPKHLHRLRKYGSASEHHEHHCHSNTVKPKLNRALNLEGSLHLNQSIFYSSGISLFLKTSWLLQKSVYSVWEFNQSFSLINY